MGFLRLLALVFFVIFSGQLTADDESFKVTVNGVAEAVASNIQAGLDGFKLSEREDRHFNQRLEQSLQDSLQALGYYAASYTLLFDEARLIINVTSGDPVRWLDPQVRVNGSGSEHAEMVESLQSIPFKAGDTLNHAQYEALKSLLIDVSLRNGYRDAAYSKTTLLIDVEAGTALAMLTLETGERYRIGNISHTGSKIHDEVLDKLVVAKPGDWYDRRIVAKQYKAMLDSAYFANVQVDSVNDSQNNIVDLDIYLHDELKDKYMVGAGFGTDTGPRVRLNWNKPIVNKKGQSLSADLELSKPIQRIEARYKFPWIHPVDNYLEWIVAYEHKLLDDTDSTVLKSGLNSIKETPKLKRTYGVSLEHEIYTQGSAPLRSTTYVIPMANWSNSRLPGPDKNGYRYWLDLQASANFLGSDTEFLRGEVGLKYHYRMGPNNVWALRTELGKLLANEAVLVPSSKRFFAGGAQSIRGFAYDSISPRNANDELIGAKNLVTASLEHRWYFKGSWGVAAFVDSGKAFNDSSEPWRTGAGLGLRWSSGVGLISVDVAVPIDDPEYSGYQIHIYMGPPI
ncbi:MAG: autotransporter assembly complex family protein [Pseudomonadales bacterium]